MKTVTFQVEGTTVFPAETVLEDLPCFRDPPGLVENSAELDLDYVLPSEGGRMSRFECVHATAEFLQSFMGTHASLEKCAFHELAGRVKHGAVGSALYKVKAGQKPLLRSALFASLSLLRELDERVLLQGWPEVVDETLDRVGSTSAKQAGKTAASTEEASAEAAGARSTGDNEKPSKKKSTVSSPARTAPEQLKNMLPRTRGVDGLTLYHEVYE